VDTGKELISD